MDLLTHAYTWFNAHLGIIGGYAGIGAAVAVVVQTLKVKFHIDQKYIKSLKLDGPKLVNIALTVVTALPLIAELVVEKLNDDPTQINGNYAYIFIAAVWLHRFAVSPLYAKVQNFLESKQAVKDKAAAYDQLVATQTRVSAPVQPTTSAVVNDVQAYDPTLALDQ